MDSSQIDSPDSALTLTIAASFTAKAIEQPLAFWLEELDLPARIAFAPYNQPFQQLLDHSSLLSTNTRGINIMLIRLEDWQADRANREAGEADAADWRLDLEQKVTDFVAAMTAAAARSTIPHLLVSCPASPPANGRSSFFAQMEDALVAGLTRVPGVDVVRSAELMGVYGVRAYYDPQSDKVAHIPYTPLFFTALASMIVRRIYGLAQADYKAVVVDCDQLLWTGICGEDGPLGVGIDSARQAIQDFLVHLHDKGILLCLCSRNSEADVLEVFQRRSEMRLKSEHIVASRLNWKPKSENIRALARELRLAPDAFVFLDDDPVECAEVQANCPEALTIQTPKDSESIPGFLRNLWIFHGSKATDEASQRTAFYKQDVARGRVMQDAPTLADFLVRLAVKVHFDGLVPRHLARASELTHRTNQFNLTTIRRSEAEIDVLQRKGTECLMVRVKDRFGDYGLVGLLTCSAASEALVVDTFLLSCRALGRGVEHRMLGRLGEMAVQQGLARVDLPFVFSGKNQPALDFLRDVAGDYEESQDPGSVFRIPTAIATQVRYRPKERSQDDHDSAGGSVVAPVQVPSEHVGRVHSAGPAVDTRAKAALLVSIARDLSDPEQIHAQVSARTRARPDLDRQYVAPRTPVEQRIAGIVAEILGVDRVGVEDNFFELGGHSLLAMQVLSRIRAAFQVELSARLLYSGAFTAAELARKVVELQLRAADPQQIATLLERLNELSDDEVRVLLARGADAPREPPA